MALSIKEQMFIEEMREGFARAKQHGGLNSDEDFVVGLSMSCETAFLPDGTLYEFGKAVVKEFKKAYPQHVSRIDAFVASGGTTQP